MDKKGQVLGETVTVIWRLLIIAGIVLTIAMSMSIVFSAKQDVRQVEIAVLSQVVLDCIAPEGVLKKIEVGSCIKGSEREYFIEVNASSIESNFNYFSTFGQSLKVECEVAEKFEKAPACLEQKHYVLIDNNGKIEKGVLNMLLGIRKLEENL